MSFLRRSSGGCSVGVCRPHLVGCSGRCPSASLWGCLHRRCSSGVLCGCPLFRSPPGDAAVGVHPSPSTSHPRIGCGGTGGACSSLQPPAPSAPPGRARGGAGAAPQLRSRAPIAGTHRELCGRARPFYSRDKPRPLTASQWELSDASGGASPPFVMSQ